MNWLTNFVRPTIRSLVRKRETPSNLWEKCTGCEKMVFHRDLVANFHVCPHCDHHMRLGARDRLRMVYVETSRGHDAIAFRPDIGASLPMLASAIGRAWLAQAPADLRAAVLDGLRDAEPDDWHRHADAIPAAIAESGSKPRGPSQARTIGAARSSSAIEVAATTPPAIAVERTSVARTHVASPRAIASP